MKSPIASLGAVTPPRTPPQPRVRQLARSAGVCSAGLALLLFASLAARPAFKGLASKPAAAALARLSQEVTVQAAGRGNPQSNLADGHQVWTEYAGPAELVALLQQNQAQPRALATADFDEDGVPDLIGGYASADAGLVTLLRGNVDAIYPNAPAAQQRRNAGTFTDAPFLSPARAFAVPQAPDFIGAGDFDGDSHWDLVTAARGSNQLYLLAGDARGGFVAPQEIILRGRVTALATGEINRRDGLNDVVVGVNGEEGPQVLVYEGPNGALRAQAEGSPLMPEVFQLSNEATAFALDETGDNFGTKLAVVTGQELLIIYGRDRRLSLDAASQATVPRARIARVWLGFTARAVVSGHFTSQSNDLAFLSTEGEIYQLRLSGRAVEKLALGSWPQATTLARARVSGQDNDDLVVVDQANHQLHLVSFAADATPLAASLNARGEPRAASLNVSGEPLALLPMRLNADALSDLVTLSSGQSAPAVTATLPGQTFTVTNTNNDGAGSLKRAIEEANAQPGADVIVFSIPGPGPHTINPGTPISDTVTIDGTPPNPSPNQPSIKLTGLFVGDRQFNTTAHSSVLRGLEITSELGLGNVSNCIIEGNVARFMTLYRRANRNLIGGTASPARNVSQTITVGFDFEDFAHENVVRGNDSPIVKVGSDCDNNVIGGTLPGAGNIISGANGFLSTGEYSEGTIIQGNTITGHTGSGVVLNHSFRSTVGGTIDAARNVISGNGGDGIVINDNSRNNLVQGNFIGTDQDGKTALGNKGEGVSLFDAAESTIGGTVPGARNIISANASNGVSITGFPVGLNGVGNLIQGNFIGTDISGAGALGNSGHGVFLSAQSFGNFVESNRIAYNSKAGVRLPFIEGFGRNPRFNRILYNSTFFNGGLGIDLGDEGPTDNDDKDPDAGPNDLQNFPTLTSVTSDGQTTTIRGLLNSVPGDTFAVQFFLNKADGTTFFAPSEPCRFNDQSLLGEARNITTDAAGNGSFEITFPTSSIGGFVNCTATSASGSAVGNTSELSECMVVVPTADLGVNIQAAGDVLSGSDLTYCASVTNGGPAAADDVKLTIQLPANTTLKSAHQVSRCGAADQLEGWQREVNGATVTFKTSSLEAQATAYFALVVTAQPRAQEEVLTATAAVTSTSPPDPNPSNDRSESRIRLLPSVDLSLTLQGAPENAFEDEDITYTATVRNTGPPAAADVRVELEVPVGTTFRISSAPPGWRRLDGTQTGQRGTIVYVIDSLAPTPEAAGAVFTILVKVDREMPNQRPPALIVNTVRVSSSVPDRDLSNNAATIMTNVMPARRADLGVNIQAAGDVLGGGTLTYCATVTNSGPAAANEVSVKVQLPANATLQSAHQVSGCSAADQLAEWQREVSGATITFKTSSLAAQATAYFALIVTVELRAQDDFLLATAEVTSASSPDPNPGNNRSESRVRLVPSVDLSVALQAPPGVFGDEEISYVVTVRNAGPPAAEDVRVELEVPVGTTFRSNGGPSGWRRADVTQIGQRGTITYVTDRLAQVTEGGGAVFTVVVRVVNQQLPAVIVNTARVSSSVPDRDLSNNAATTMTNVVARPPGPLIQEITVAGDQIIVRGFYFLAPVRIFIDDVGFVEEARINSDGRQLTQTGRLTNGQSIAQAIPPGQVVRVTFINRDGGKVEVPLKN